MLAEERFAAILFTLQKQRTVTALELIQALSISEPTIRRDLVALYKMEKLKKAHGGATLLYKEYGLYETEVAARSEERVEEKKRIACYVASLIRVHDLVYTDVGSTTLHTVEYLKGEEAIYVANGLEHGRRPVVQSFRTFLLASELKSKTEAVVGLGAVSSSQKYSLNKAFLGIDGITVSSDFTTSDTNEVYAKMEAMKYAQKCYVLADSGKFGTCISITTVDISDATIITDKGMEKEYLEEADIIEVEEWSIW